VIPRLAQFVLGSVLATSTAWAAPQLDLPKKPGTRPPNPADVLHPPAPSKGDLAPRDGAAAPLDLPGKSAPAPDAPPPPAAGTSEDATRALFRDLAGVRDAHETASFLERGLALGPAVLPLARVALASEHAPTLLVAGRLLLTGGTSTDRAAVAERLMRMVPAEVAAPLLAELVTRDPMLSAPEYLLGLVDHPSSAMRSAALAELEHRAGKLPLNSVAPLFNSQRTATRTAALELASKSDDPLALNLLASRLGDPSAQLARRAADLLAALDGAESLLLERAFPAGSHASPLAWDRPRAYALLGVIQREENTQRALLGEKHVEEMLIGLRSSLPLVTGACAVGLARAGFRLGPSHAGPWLDREVPHMLVRSGTGAEFHNDFSSLERPALRALTLLTGESFGADGEAWRRWWLDHADGFHARHAVIELSPGASDKLLVSFTDARGRVWSLVGPAREAGPGDATVLRLDSAAAERLSARIEADGVFGVERLPSARVDEEIALRVAVGEQEKAFARAGGATSAWLGALEAELEQVVEENRWQLYFDPAQTSARDWWQGQHERWAGLAPLERARALVPLVIAAARRARDDARDVHVEELESLYRDAAVPAAQDFEPLLALLASETSFGPRAERLLELTRVATASAESAASESHPRERLVTLALEHFGPEASAAFGRVARELDLESLRSMARDARPGARALAAHGLVRKDSEEVPGLLRALLADLDPSVQLAVLEALDGSSVQRSGEPWPELLERARSGPASTRATALRELARWGGKAAHDLALEAVGDPEETVQQAGVAALAELADPRNASLLASLLARGAGSPLFLSARRGLVRMGPAGIEECRRLVRSASPRARREAAFVLSEALVPDAAPVLLALLEENPADDRVAWEFSVLACQDFVGAEHPNEAARSWWELVVHDDPTAWLLAAAERAGVPAPPRAALDGKLGAEGARFLLALADLSLPQICERATRELERRLAFELSRPASVAERAHFRAELHEAVRARIGD
jgi:HEAT repeat protein